MRLIDIYNEAIKDSDRLVLLYDKLTTRNQRAIRSDWRDSFYEAKLTTWPQSAGLWRSKSETTLIIGTDGSGLSHRDFNHESLAIFLKMALVMTMAAADKILHEAVSKQFVKAITSKEIDHLAKIQLSRTYEVAMAVRKRRGKGGKIRSRPTTHLKKEMQEKLYWQTFLSNDALTSVCKALDEPDIYGAFGRTQTPAISSQNAKQKWVHVYKRRNQITHECDIVRQQKMRRVNRHTYSATDLKADITFAKRFGAFLAADLDT
jgi:hypothetical protein